MPAQARPSKADYLTLVKPIVHRSPMAELQAEGFSGRALMFSRLVGDVKQEVRFSLSVRPAYAKNDAHLQLTTSILPMGVLETYRAMMPEDPDPARSCRLVAPIESIARERVGRWLFRDQMSAAALESRIHRAVVTSVIPYLAKTTSPASLIALCQGGADALGNTADSTAVIGAALARTYAGITG